MNGEQPHWNQHELQLERFKKYKREADTHRLLHQARSSIQPAPRFYHTILDHLGRILVAWGVWLQERFSPCRLNPSANNGDC